ncbi:glycosyltransferase family protein [Wenyingzhuangia sp. chi5]|uniref:Glycosyltransferase family protein n=1 Tax=Wenyingzhuangia gilva TaxID=3057677 RepID=A0ABT8VSB2_9FLAO|nr:glycosyltransferase family protein [Wenyingzhuangia sp. chi5]MDO3694860.1 glycosyltransferase family protein [Wenyingzhuangia sp. chi5]
MKVLYAIQGTGNGHLSRARDIVPILQKKVDLDILVSGVQADVKLPFEIKYQLQGMSFIFGKKGGVDLWKTVKNSDFNQFRKEMNKINIKQYDLVINDFEPLSAWAAKLNNIPCVSMSHQAAVKAKESPKPKKKDFIGERILKRYAPTDAYYGFHFKKYNSHIYTPVIRKEIRDLNPISGDYYTVYLPAYGDKKLIAFFNQFEETNWQVFSKHTKNAYKNGNVIIEPINNTTFIKSFENCTGMICGAGFETPAEALYLKKKLLVIPMKNQYEQQCNAQALLELGVPVIKKLKNKHAQIVKEWINEEQFIPVEYADETEEIIDLILSKYSYL